MNTYEVGDWVVFVIFNRETIGVITQIDGGRVCIDAGAGDLLVKASDIVEVFG